MKKILQGRALITGATSGIGLALAYRFAKSCHSLILHGRNAAVLEDTARNIREIYQVNVEIIAVDLLEEGAPDKLFYEVQKKGGIDILVNNAGYQVYGDFAYSRMNDIKGLITVNLEVPSVLCRLFSEDMKRKQRGWILNLASTGAFAPNPYNAVYCATKAYILSLSEAIGYELRSCGVCITALCPGATVTEFAKKADIEATPYFKYLAMDANKVANIGYRALAQKKSYVITGLLNWWLIFSLRLTPRLLVTGISAMFMKK